MMKNQAVLIAIGIFVLVFGLLIWRRFDMAEQLSVVVTATQGETSYSTEDSIRRGAFVETKDEYLKLEFGEGVFISLDKNSSIELEDLGLVGPVVRLHKGRILVTSETTPTWITTDTTENTVAGGSATFINYDFLETVHIVPIESSVQTTIKSINEYLLLPVPIAVHEGYEASYEPIEVNLDAGESAEFYEWSQTH